MQNRLQNSLNAAVSIAAVVVAIAVVHREFFRRSPGSTEPSIRQPVQDAPVYVEDWVSIIDDGILVGDISAPVKVIEFADLECPFCKRFHSVFTEAKVKHGASLALVFVHYPIASHRFADPAARAAECAGTQGNFGTFVDVVFGKQDSLGLKSWASYASEAGVQDTAGFVSCLSDRRPVERIERGKALASRLDIRGTPTILVNGWRYAVPPYESLGAIADSIVAAHRRRPQ